MSSAIAPHTYSLPSAVVGVIPAYHVRCPSSRHSFIKGGKVPQVDSLAIMPDLSSPLVNPANPKDAYISAFVVRWNPHIPKVLRFGNKPKVFWSVVSLIAVNVVYVTIWPLFMRHQPNDSMGKIFITHKAPREIAGAVFNIESRL